MWPPNWSLPWSPQISAILRCFTKQLSTVRVTSNMPAEVCEDTEVVVAISREGHWLFLATFFQAPSHELTCSGGSSPHHLCPTTLAELLVGPHPSPWIYAAWEGTQHPQGTESPCSPRSTLQLLPLTWLYAQKVV